MSMSPVMSPRPPLKKGNAKTLPTSPKKKLSRNQSRIDARKKMLPGDKKADKKQLKSLRKQLLPDEKKIDKQSSQNHPKKNFPVKKSNQTSESRLDAKKRLLPLENVQGKCMTREQSRINKRNQLLPQKPTEKVQGPGATQIEPKQQKEEEEKSTRLEAGRRKAEEAERNRIAEEKRILKEKIAAEKREKEEVEKRKREEAEKKRMAAEKQAAEEQVRIKAIEDAKREEEAKKAEELRLAQERAQLEELKRKAAEEQAIESAKREEEAELANKRARLQAEEQVKIKAKEDAKRNAEAKWAEERRIAEAEALKQTKAENTRRQQEDESRRKQKASVKKKYRKFTSSWILSVLAEAATGVLKHSNPAKPRAGTALKAEVAPENKSNNPSKASPNVMSAESVLNDGKIPSREQLWKIFLELDSNGNGLLEESELKSTIMLRSDLGQFVQPRVFTRKLKAIVKNTDSSEIGIDFDQFRKLVTQSRTTVEPKLSLPGETNRPTKKQQSSDKSIDFLDTFDVVEQSTPAKVLQQSSSQTQLRESFTQTQLYESTNGLDNFVVIGNENNADEKRFLVRNLLDELELEHNAMPIESSVSNPVGEEEVGEELFSLLNGILERETQQQGTGNVMTVNVSKNDVFDLPTGLIDLVWTEDNSLVTQTAPSKIPSDIQSEKMLRKMLRGLPLTLRRLLRALNKIRTVVEDPEKLEPLWLQKVSGLSEEGQKTVVNIVTRRIREIDYDKRRMPYIKLVHGVKEKLKGRRTKAAGQLMLKSPHGKMGDLTFSEFQLWIRNFYAIPQVVVEGHNLLKTFYDEVLALKYATDRGNSTKTVTLQKVHRYVKQFQENVKYVADFTLSELFKDALNQKKQIQETLPNSEEIEQRNRIITTLHLSTRQALRSLHDAFELSDLKEEDTQRLAALNERQQEEVCARCREILRKKFPEASARKVLLYSLKKMERKLGQKDFAHKKDMRYNRRRGPKYSKTKLRTASKSKTPHRLKGYKQTRSHFARNGRYGRKIAKPDGKSAKPKAIPQKSKNSANFTRRKEKRKNQAEVPKIYPNNGSGWYFSSKHDQMVSTIFIPRDSGTSDPDNKLDELYFWTDERKPRVSQRVSPSKGDILLAEEQNKYGLDVASVKFLGPKAFQRQQDFERRKRNRARRIAARDARKTQGMSLASSYPGAAGFPVFPHPATYPVPIMGVAPQSTAALNLTAPAQTQPQTQHFRPPAQPPNFTGVVLFESGKQLAKYDSI